MKLIISPMQELGNRIFTSADVVTGHVSLYVNNTLAISEIVFTIKARLQSAECAAAGAEYPGVPSFSTLFKLSQILFPHTPLVNSTRYTLGPGRHDYHFGVDFSLLSRYAQAELFSNPAFRPSERWNINNIFYTIRVTATRCGPLRRQVCKSLYLKSVTIDPPGIPRFPSSRGLSRQACQVLHIEAFGLRKRRPKGDGEVPPPYQPAIVVRAGITSDGGLLYPGDSLPLKLWVTVPSGVQRQLTAFLKSVHLFMIDPILVRDCMGRVVRLADTFIREIDLQIPLKTNPKEERIEVDPASWKGCKVPRSLSTPKSIHKVQQPYLLQVLCEFSRVGMTGTIFTSVLIPVDVATTHAPPKYEAVASKSERHKSEDGLPGYELCTGYDGTLGHAHVM